MQLNNYQWFQAQPADSAKNALPGLKVRRLGLQAYEPIFKSMRYRAEHPLANRDDEIWLLSHKPVFTLGQAGKAEHVLNPGRIPVVQVDRGGQVTYHGPGQLVCYLLLNLKRRKLGVRALVDIIESTLITTLQEYGIDGVSRPKAPGVYVNNAKIAALGLRVKNGWSYHGLSFNLNMDLEPFSRINPCGFEGLAVTQLSQLVAQQEGLMQSVSRRLANQLLLALGYQAHSYTTVK
ncbi:MAG: lipoyl(octanoyl) transferase LipB [Gammaproteobacteria bacterium]|nr:lipoyl(octanoyl) transferase LipB [Gammaproteobacteria bacterium]